MKPLTFRERDCLLWASRGKTSWEIGCILGIAERTVNFHIGNICCKLGVRNRQAAITMALEWGLISAGQPGSSAPARNPAPAPGRKRPARQSPQPRASHAH